MKYLLASSVLFVAFFLSGCSTNIASNVNLMPGATFLRSDNAGQSWEPKIRIDDKKTIAGIDVLSMAANPFDPNNIFLGTEANGLFETKDGGETWQQIPFANRVYGLAFDPQVPNVIYGSGVYEGRGKVYKRLGADQEWKEIYTEPSEDTIISSLAIDIANPQNIFIGTSNGIILKSINGGETWLDLPKADGPVVGIVFDVANSSHMFFAIFQSGILESKDGGRTMENVTRKMDPLKSTTTIYGITADPFMPGVVYVGTGNGIFRRQANDSWSEINIIESSKAYPIRTIAVNPKDSRQIMYSSAKAIYRSNDSGLTWSTFQLDTSKEIGVLRFDQTDPQRIFAGLRKF